jgi:M6 family metalloprotease-like protein
VRPSVVWLVGLAALPLFVTPSSAAAQSGFHPRWEIPGFDFRKNGAWRVRAQRVADLRRQLVAQGRLGTLNAARLAGPAPSSTQVTGTILVPALLFSYHNTDSTLFMKDTAQYTSVLFGPVPPGSNPYTLRTFYEQMSNNVFSMRGKMIGWVRLDSNEVTYTGTAGTCNGNPFGTTNCNGIFSVAATKRMQDGFRQALARVDTGAAGINFAQFDNDGPDLVPNSGDDDGYVDMIMFAHPTKDGACGGSNSPNPPGTAASNNHIWSHRFVLVNATSTNFQDYVTNDPSAEGGTIKISDYFATTALGGASACDTTSIMPIGTAAHEFGHALGLPDLYDTQGASEGIGEWGLMGSGNFTSPRSPSRMEAWSLNELGWLSLRILTTTGTYHFGAAPVSDTAFYVNVQGSNPRHEYFLLENRQASQADTAQIRIHCVRASQPSNCPGGMLIWHVDSLQAASNGFHSSNAVNAGPVHGLKVEEADGLRQLWCEANGCNRGDAGDYYPGVSNNRVFSFNTIPAATKNLDGSFVGFAVDSITQVVPGGEMSFRLRFGGLTVVRGSDTTAVISMDAVNYNVFRDLLDDASLHTVSVADTQLSFNNRTRWRFASWSDGLARSHTITANLAGGTITATLSRDFKIVATAGANGTIASNPVVDLSGTFMAQGSPVQLTATPNGGFVFGGWTGDTTFSTAIVTLPMGRPYTVTANFALALAISSAAARPNGVMGAAYNDTLAVTGGSGTNSWTVTGGALPQGLTLAASSGVLSGFPRETGNFSYQATVVSGAQNQSRTFTFSVTAPSLVTADVVTQLLGPGTPLNVDQVRYLDYLGNSNSFFDIGDFLAWVKTTGAPLSAEAMAKLAQKGARP